MPVLAPSNTTASSAKGFEKGASSTAKEQDGGESARDAAKSADNNSEVSEQIHSDAGVLSEVRGSMSTIIKGIFTKDVFQHIAGETSRLAHYDKRTASAAQEIHAAMRLLLSHELAKHTGSEVTKAPAKYASTKRA